MNVIKPKIKDHYFYHHGEFFHHYFDITRAFLETDYETGMHVQEFYEINIITKGKGIHFIEEKHVEANIGDVFIIPPNVSHGYIGGAGFNVFHILISNKFMQKYTSDLQQFPSYFTLFNAEPIMRGSSDKPFYLSLNNEQFTKVNELLNKLIENENPDNPVNAIIQSNYTMILLIYFCEVYSINPHIYSKNLPHSDEAFMKAISTMHERYYEKLTIDNLCDIAKLSRSSFIKKFKKICKVPPLQYLTRIRIDAAKSMLINTSYTITEIANNTGFFDAAHFSKSFEKEEGISPTQYRKEYLK